MREKFLKQIVLFVVGKSAEPIAVLLDNKNYVNEFILAKKIDMTINQTRNILYKLSDYGLVSYSRKKDKKKGWYTYFWKFEVLKSLQFLRNLIEKKKEQLENQINNREANQFYLCERCNIEFNESNALLHDFVCDECGSVFVLKNDFKLIKELKRNIERFEKELKDIDLEIEKERSKIEKILEKERKKELKRKEKEKEEKKKARRFLKEKEKKSKKKDIIKKPKMKKNKKIKIKKIVIKKKPEKKQVKKNSSLKTKKSKK